MAPVKLVDDWKNFWKWWSVRITTVLAVIGPVWLSLPPELQDDLPVELLPYVSPVVLMSIVVARVLDQAKLHEEK